jgi:hypothetical protein
MSISLSFRDSIQLRVELKIRNITQNKGKNSKKWSPRKNRTKTEEENSRKK